MGLLYQDNVNSSMSHAEAYTYDSLNRLTNAVATGNSTYNLTFAYDRYGNMTCQTNAQTQGLCPNYSFDPTTNRINISGFQYGAAGNLISDGARSYVWDAEDRLISSTESGQPSGWLYDAQGRMVEKTSVIPHSYTHERLYDPQGLLQSYWNTSYGDWGFRFVLLGSRRLGFDNEGSNEYFEHDDGLGSITMVTQHDGSLESDQPYYPWGSPWDQVNPSDPMWAKMTGSEDFEGLASTPNREYGLSLGRWLTPDPGNAGADPSNPQSWNAYSYAGNNPTTNTDPSGLYCVQDGNGNWYDDGNGGESCSHAFASDKAEAKNPSVTVTGKAGNVAEAVAANAGIGLSNLLIDNANLFYTELTFGQYSPNLPYIPAGSGVAANIGALAPLVGIAVVGGPEGEAEDLGGLSRELGVSVNTLKHISKHLREFQKLDAAADLRQVVQLGQDIVRSGIQTGPRTFENTVGVGGSMVRVRAVLNYAGSLRSVYIVP